ncbi:fumarylacetoacetate hydrolase family protein [Microbacterium sp. RD1]|uniref:fumarylacetoacetate hydrolase family protein n=1 Tax=Microbacterium sp. RD1 TaxID=3457313 RepID=UPI003FA547E1
MKLASYVADGRSSYGVVADDEVIDIGSADPDRPTLRLALANDLEHVRQAVDARRTVYPLADVTLLPPVPDPGKILCIGVNYRDHREESGLSIAPQHPTVFTRFADTHVAHDHPIYLPRNSTELDYEGEVAVVLGHSIAQYEEDADALMGAIAGFSCYNDASIRDWQVHNSQWTPGKNFAGVGSFGPWITTMEAFDDLDATRLQTRVNGTVVQSATLADLIFDLSAILRYLAGFTPLSPGDVIVTGTPGGVGVVADPPVFLRAGDVVEVDVSGVGTLRNEIRSPLASAAVTTRNGKAQRS